MLIMISHLNSFFIIELNPQHALCEDLRAAFADDFGISAVTLDDVVICYQNTCKILSPSHDQLVLIYKSQRDHSMLVEEKVAYDDVWIKSQIQSCLEFWLGQRYCDFV